VSGKISADRKGGTEGSRTLATQVTRTFLNSRPSSFSTAVLRSAAVSNSTKLDECLVLLNEQFSWVDVPLVAAVAVGLGIDDIKSGLPGEVFQILKPESM
jgi:hypothetical protein